MAVQPNQQAGRASTVQQETKPKTKLEKAAQGKCCPVQSIGLRA